MQSPDNDNATAIDPIYWRPGRGNAESIVKMRGELDAIREKRIKRESGDICWNCRSLGYCPGVSRCKKVSHIVERIENFNQGE